MEWLDNCKHADTLPYKPPRLSYERGMKEGSPPLMEGLGRGLCFGSEVEKGVGEAWRGRPWN